MAQVGRQPGASGGRRSLAVVSRRQLRPLQVAFLLESDGDPGRQASSGLVRSRRVSSGLVGQPGEPDGVAQPASLVAESTQHALPTETALLGNPLRRRVADVDVDLEALHGPGPQGPGSDQVDHPRGDPAASCSGTHRVADVGYPPVGPCGSDTDGPHDDTGALVHTDECELVAGVPPLGRVADPGLDVLRRVVLGDGRPGLDSRVAADLDDVVDVGAVGEPQV